MDHTDFNMYRRNDRQVIDLFLRKVEEDREVANPPGDGKLLRAGRRASKPYIFKVTHYVT